MMEISARSRELSKSCSRLGSRDLADCIFSDSFFSDLSLKKSESWE